jgi:hypothetical protein
MTANYGGKGRATRLNEFASVCSGQKALTVWVIPAQPLENSIHQKTEKLSIPESGKVGENEARNLVADMQS